MPKKILVVDDDPVIVKLLDSTLVAAGYEVVVAHDGIDAMVQVKNVSPDLIVLDIMMPEINGYEVCTHLKFDEQFKHIPIILLTSREQELDGRISKMMGIEYLHKPLQPQALLDLIQQALRK